MLIVAGVIEIDPANREKAVGVATRMMEETRREPGCVSYVFSADLASPGTFRLFEEWRSQADLDAHFATPHMATFQAAMGGLGVKRVDIHKYQIAAKGPVR